MTPAFFSHSPIYSVILACCCLTESFNQLHCPAYTGIISSEFFCLSDLEFVIFTGFDLPKYAWFLESFSDCFLGNLINILFSLAVFTMKQINLIPVNP